MRLRRALCLAPPTDRFPWVDDGHEQAATGPSPHAPRVGIHVVEKFLLLSLCKPSLGVLYSCKNPFRPQCQRRLGGGPHERGVDDVGSPSPFAHAGRVCPLDLVSPRWSCHVCANSMYFALFLSLTLPWSSTRLARRGNGTSSGVDNKYLSWILIATVRNPPGPKGTKSSREWDATPRQRASEMVSSGHGGGRRQSSGEQAISPLSVADQRLRKDSETGTFSFLSRLPSALV